MARVKVKKKGRFFGFILLTIVILLLFNAKGILRAIFPLSYEEMVSKYSNEYNLDYNLVMGIIKAESNFNSNAVSNKGAKGLMQLTDETGEWVAKKMGMENFTNDLLTDPQTNINIGCYYFRYLLDKYNQDKKTALAAYNAGPGRVDGWLKDSRYSIDGKKIDSIPYKETSDYVNKVTTYKSLFENIYDGGNEING